MAFCVLIALLLGLPVILSWTRPPSPEQSFISISYQAGPIGVDAAEMFDDPRDADILFVGSSRVLWGIDTEAVEKALTAHLGRPAHVVKLSNNWAGEDIHLFMLQDYFQRHRARLIVYMLPQPDVVHDRPWTQIYHLVRYSQYKTVLTQLPAFDRMALYAEMVLGSPRELLSKIRPNLVGSDEDTPEYYPRYDGRNPMARDGYNGRPFVPDTLPLSPTQLYLTPVTSPNLRIVARRALGRYELHFIREFVTLAQQHDSTLVFLHIPGVAELGNTTVPQLASWSTILGPNYGMIGIPATALFPGFSRERMLNFFSDDLHFNYNGRIAFTAKIIPSILQAYGTAPSGIK